LRLCGVHVETEGSEDRDDDPEASAGRKRHSCVTEAPS
jgi:hypothetical protein